jgi:PqqD family protein of HPr-rel-A system
MPAMKPKVRPDLTFVEVDGEGVVYDPETIELHHLNASAALVYQLCDGTGTVKELARDIAEELELPADQTLKQIRRVVTQFRYSGILTGKRPEPKPHQGHQHHHREHADG